MCSQRPRPEPELKRPVFRIIPDKVVLEPFENCFITLEGSSQEWANTPNNTSHSIACMKQCLHIIIRRVVRLIVVGFWWILNQTRFYDRILAAGSILTQSLFSLGQNQWQSVSSVMPSLARMRTRRGSWQWTFWPTSSHLSLTSAQEKYHFLHTRCIQSAVSRV